MQQSYQLGTKYVTDIARIEPLLTSLDIQAIKEMTDIFCAKFWGRVQMQVFDMKIPTSGLIEEMTLPNDSFNPNFIVNSLSIAITSQALSEATKTKASMLLPPPSPSTAANTPDLMNPATELQAGTTYKSIQQRVSAEVQREFPGSTFTSEGTYPTNTLIINPPPLDISVVYMWVTTIDERTCEYCVSLHGQTWELDDSDSIPNIPDETHPNCRCRIMLVESDFAASVAEQRQRG